MPEISLTDAQYEQLEAIRADVEDVFVDTYGHARLEDAVDYLLDTYTPPDERDSVVVAEDFERIATAGYSELQHIAADVPNIPGSGIDSDVMRGKLLAELGPVELAERLAEDIDDGVDVDPEMGQADGDDDSAVEPTTVADSDGAEQTSDAGGDSEATVDDSSEATADEDEGSTGGGPVDPLATPGNPLAGVNELLHDHDDKWRKTDTGDEPYEVDLPDGTTKGVRTKDDVRQYLFKHY